MIVHLLSCSPSETEILMNCLSSMGANDTLVLLEDGVYTLQTPERLKNLKPKQIHYILFDTQARGLNIDQSLGIGIGYEELVNLIASHSKSISWF